MFISVASITSFEFVFYLNTLLLSFCCLFNMVSIQRYILLEMSIYNALFPLWKYLYAKTDEQIHPLNNSYLNCQKH